MTTFATPSEDGARSGSQKKNTALSAFGVSSKMPSRVLHRAALALARLERRDVDAERDALAAGRAGRAEVDGPEATPPALEHRLELARRDLDLHAYLELLLAIREVRVGTCTKCTLVRSGKVS